MNWQRFFSLWCSVFLSLVDSGGKKRTQSRGAARERERDMLLCAVWPLSHLISDHTQYLYESFILEMLYTLSPFAIIHVSCTLHAHASVTHWFAGIGFYLALATLALCLALIGTFVFVYYRLDVQSGKKQHTNAANAFRSHSARMTVARTVVEKWQKAWNKTKASDDWSGLKSIPLNNIPIQTAKLSSSSVHLLLNIFFLLRFVAPVFTSAEWILRNRTAESNQWTNDLCNIYTSHHERILVYCTRYTQFNHFSALIMCYN